MAGRLSETIYRRGKHFRNKNDFGQIVKKYNIIFFVIVTVKRFL